MNTDFYPCNPWLKLTEDLEARGGVEPRAFPPSSLWFGLEDRCRERGLRLEAMVRLELTRFCLQDSRSANWSYIALFNWGTGRKANAPLRTPRSRDSLRSARMSHAPITANRIWRSELESNQPFGFFRPALIRLSYPTKRGLTFKPSVFARCVPSP